MSNPETYTCPAHGEYVAKNFPDTDCEGCEVERRERTKEWERMWVNWRRWKDCGIPLRYTSSSLNSWEPKSKTQSAILAAVRAYADGFSDNFRLGRGLLLLGDIGTGKTHLACGVLTEAISQGYKGIFTSATGLFANLKEEFGGKRREGESAAETCARRDLLVIDDIGAHRGTDWEVGVLHQILDARYAERLPTILTSNSEDFDAFVGVRVADRLIENSLRLTFKGNSQRASASTAPRSGAALPRPPDTLTITLSVRGQNRTRSVEANERSTFGLVGQTVADRATFRRNAPLGQNGTPPNRLKELTAPNRRA